MLHALEGLKKCHLYIVKNFATSDDAQVSYDSDDDMSEQVGYIAKFTYYTKNGHIICMLI